MRLLLSVTTITGCILFGYSQGYQPLGAQSASLAHASITGQNAEAYFHNPGSIPDKHASCLLVGFSNPFLISDFSTLFFSGSHRIKAGMVAVGGTLSGNTAFRHIKIGSGYGLKLTDNFSLGIQLNVHQLKLTEFYGRKMTVTAATGGRLSINNSWSMGFAVFNFGRTKLSPYQDDRFSTLIRVGTAYQSSENVELSLECFKEVSADISMRSGIRYQWSDWFSLGLGVGIKPTLFAFGMHFRKRHFLGSITTQFHQRLGWSPVFSVLIDWP